MVVKNNAVSMPSIRSELPVQSKKPPTYKNPSSAEMMMKLKHIREARALEDAKRKEVTDRARYCQSCGFLSSSSPQSVVLRSSI